MIAIVPVPRGTRYIPYIIIIMRYNHNNLPRLAQAWPVAPTEIANARMASSSTKPVAEALLASNLRQRAVVQADRVETRSQGRVAPDSMSFLAPYNERKAKPGSRGVSSGSSSRSQDFAIGVAILLVGCVTAAIVNAMLFITEKFSTWRIGLVVAARTSASGGVVMSWLTHIGFAIPCATVAFMCVLAIPMSRGSGLPQLIAYLNGVKIRKFTSARLLVAKFIGTTMALCGGFYCGPEGPIIHMGGCVGKLLLRGLYHASRLPFQVFRPFAELRNDLDQRDFVAIGAGAGVAAAFGAPISGVIFVVEEAASHFSLQLLWRAFTAAIISLWACHWLNLFEWLIELLLGSDSGGDAGGGGSGGDTRAAAHHFQIKFGVGSGPACDLPDAMVVHVIPLAIVGGLLGALLNHLILSAARLRTRIVGPHPSLRRRALTGGAELLVLTLLSSSASVLLPELLPCKALTIGQLEYGFVSASSKPGQCAAAYGQCDGVGWATPKCCELDYVCHKWGPYYAQCVPSGGTTIVPLNEACMAEALSSQIKWTNAVNHTCDATCLEEKIAPGTLSMLARSRCAPDEYNDLASLLLATSDDVVKALFLRGAPTALSAQSLAIALAVWFVLTVLTAGVPMPLGLMVPMICVGGCYGRLAGLALRSVTVVGFPADPGLFALLGATAVLCGSGYNIRLFFTLVMLEITDQLHLAPFVALAAMTAVLAAGAVAHHGLYHALIDVAGLPYLPLERPPDVAVHSEAGHEERGSGGDGERWCCRPRQVQKKGHLLVSDVMAAPLVTVTAGQCKADVLDALRGETHNAFPVLAEDGTLDGLLLRSELGYFQHGDPVERIMDRAPACVRASWPLDRAHRLFIALGLRHLLAVDQGGRPVGIITRHDLQQSRARPSAIPTATDAEACSPGAGSSSNSISFGATAYQPPSDPAQPLNAASSGPGSPSLPDEDSTAAELASRPSADEFNDFATAD